MASTLVRVTEGRFLTRPKNSIFNHLTLNLFPTKNRLYRFSEMQNFILCMSKVTCRVHKEYPDSSLATEGKIFCKLINLKQFGHLHSKSITTTNQYLNTISIRRGFYKNWLFCSTKLGVSSTWNPRTLKPSS